MSVPARLRWVAVFVVAALLAGALAADAHGTDEFGACTSPRVRVSHMNGTSWRGGMLRAAGCRAWHNLHDELTSARH